MEINHKSFSSRSNLIWFFLVITLLFSVSTIRYEHFAAKRHFGDFHVYYVTGERLRAGESIYVDDSEKLTPYKYSPLVASFFAILSIFPEAVAASVWHWLNLFFLMGSALLSLRLAKDHQVEEPLISKREIVLGSIGILGVSPVILHCLNSGQVGLSILYFFLLGAFFANQEKENLSAFFFALSAMFKYLPILVAPYLWLSGRRRLSMLLALWFVLFHFIPALWLGWARNLVFLKGFLPFLTSTTLDHVSLLDFKNQSMWAYLYRLIFYDLGYFAIREHPGQLAIVGTILFLIFYGMVVFSGKIGRVTKGRAFVIDCALLVILIFNPNAWKHNFVLLLFPYLILVSKVSQAKWRGPELFALLLTSALVFFSKRDFIGWDLRFELMSASVLLLASLSLFTVLLISKRTD